MRILTAVLLANVLVLLADWFFFGVLWHEKYLVFPEVWRRPRGGPGEGKAVALSAVVGALTPSVFVAVCALMGLSRPAQAFPLAAAVWLMSVVPALVWNYLFVKTHPLILLGGLVGWLVRLGLSAGVVAWVLR